MAVWLASMACVHVTHIPPSLQATPASLTATYSTHASVIARFAARRISSPTNVPGYLGLWLCGSVALRVALGPTTGIDETEEWDEENDIGGRWLLVPGFPCSD